MIGISEENKTAMGKIFLFTERTEARTSYEVELRFDTRDIPFYKAVQDVSKWYESYYQPLPVTEYCTLPMYSTWYSYHQDFTHDQLEYECTKFIDYGFKSIIVDDGWQTEDNNRGYAYCGDWQTAKNRIPDFKKHVNHIHELGMKYLLWYAVPFIGYHTDAWNKYKDYMLYEVDDLKTGVVDIRYKEIRDYLVNTYVSSVKEKGLDGLKLDFVDNFSHKKSSTNDKLFSGDIESLQSAFDVLFKEIVQKLMGINPDFMIEFRQNYIGPAMRQYGNIFRAADCPGNVVLNRVRTTDLRLLSGNTAVHSDMVMWSKEDKVESAALQLINILYSVPQVSVKYEDISEEHKKMLKHWLDFWLKYKNTLLSADFRAYNPDKNYTHLESVNDGIKITTYFSTEIIQLDDTLHEQIIVNGSMKETCIISTRKSYVYTLYDVIGKEVGTGTLSEKNTIYDIPKSGYIHIKMK